MADKMEFGGPDRCDAAGDVPAIGMRDLAPPEALLASIGLWCDFLRADAAAEPQPLRYWSPLAERSSASPADLAQTA